VKALWDTFERLSDADKAECQRRLSIILEVIDLRASLPIRSGGKDRTTIINEHIKTRHGIGKSTLYNWLKLVEGLDRKDWLAALAPQTDPRVFGIIGETAEVHPDAWALLKSDYLRPEAPNFAACYRRTKEAALRCGWGELPSESTVRRRLNNEVPHAVRVYARKGKEAARRLIPAQRRNKTHLHAMQMVNTDGHKLDLDVRVPWSDKPVRLFLLGIQDIYSGKILSWRLGEAETWDLVRGTVGDMVEKFGIPDRIYMDNGRAFASKMISGGAKKRHRFKVTEDEVNGLLTTLGIEPHFTTPYRGQSKPIERAWGTLAEEISKHPSMAGAYTGNNPQNKPENRGSWAVPLDVLERHVAEAIAEHNSRRGRKSPVAKGRSFDEIFADSLAGQGVIIRQATAAQRSLWLRAAEVLTARKPDGAIHLLGNRYWARELNGWIGKKVTVRFDPDRAHDPVKVYDPAGRLICEAPCIADSGFDSVDDARAQARLTSTIQKARKAELDAHRILNSKRLAALTRRAEKAESDTPPSPKPRVVRLAIGNLAAKPAFETMSDDEFTESFSAALAGLTGGASVLKFPNGDDPAKR
jgi:transposase InsO family protein